MRIRMWWHRERPQTVAARKALADADQQLAEARLQSASAERTAISLREIRRENHITQSMFPPGRKTQT
ncbi:hypothetical protein QEH44_gp24 [Arthrobacter phage Shambre1]|uniref:Uncharacterized protein n=1 Tax=Arthrobacter phage Shambre1 TaxID=2927284 RepID=A0A977KNJ9_9CAUD|nr:hypothetical protein QEH44_gp24 [Arthrobacter phage Shambre1]UXE04761.1 hypothetical protein SEA_SHAMBRE1_24 [Arthrobacter phage Shambre1]